MWYVYGDNRYPLDTSMTNTEGTAIFENDYQLTGGIFILYLTPKKALEFLLTDENIFTINLDTADISGKTTFTGSRENSIYYDFLRKFNFNEYQLEEVMNKITNKNLSVVFDKDLKKQVYDAEAVYLTMHLQRLQKKVK